MTTPGSQFPVITSQGEIQWWVVNQVSRPGGPRGPQQTNYVVVESTTRPVNTVAGPFTTKADAEAWQTSANTAGNSPGSVVGGVASDLFHGLDLTHWVLRIGEILLGVVLIGVGIAKLTGTENFVTQIVKKVPV